jgi:hypothetical protein
MYEQDITFIVQEKASQIPILQAASWTITPWLMVQQYDSTTYG